MRTKNGAFWVVLLAITLASTLALAGEYDNPHLAKYDHAKWMPPKKASAFLGYYLGKARRADPSNVVRVGRNSPAWQKLQEQFPMLKNAYHVVVMNSASPQVKQMMDTMGKEIPLVGLAIHTKDGEGSGHPHLVAHRSQGWHGEEVNGQGQTVLFDTSAGKGFNESGVFHREQSFGKLHPKNPLLYVLWAAPGRHARQVADETKGWFDNEPGNRVNQCGWPCTRFVSNRLSALGKLGEHDKGNPFPQLEEGTASWEAPGLNLNGLDESAKQKLLERNPHGHDSGRVGATNVMNHAITAPHAMVVMLPDSLYKTVVGDHGLDQDSLHKYLRVPPQ